MALQSSGGGAPATADRFEDPDQIDAWRDKFAFDNEKTHVDPGPSRRNMVLGSMTPFLPTLDPVYYADHTIAERLGGPIPFPDAPLLDRMFLTELYQVGMQGGMRSWQAGMLNKWVLDHDGGHTDTDARSGGRQATQNDPGTFSWLYATQTDHLARLHSQAAFESKVIRTPPQDWHFVFAKKNWFDLTSRIMPSVRDPVPGIHMLSEWSVDLPPLWDELSIILSIANATLQLVFSKPWFQALICHEYTWNSWTTAQDFTDRSGQPLQPPQEPLVIDPAVFLPGGWAYANQTPRERVVEATARFDKIAEHIVWCFMDERSDPTLSTLRAYTNAYLNDPFSWGGVNAPLKANKTRDDFWIPIFIHVNPLRLLLDKKTTAAERCLARGVVASTMVHELMHAVSMHIFRVQRNECTPQNKKTEYDEPFYNWEYLAELGCSMTADLHGGELNVLGGAARAVGLGSFLAAWPTEKWSQWSLKVKPPNKAPRDGMPGLINWPIPTTFDALRTMQDFWDSVVKQKAVDAVKPAKILVTVWELENSPLTEAYGQAVRACKPEFYGWQDAEMKRMCRRTIDDLDLRRRQWKVLRSPWHDQALLSWLATPYSWHMGREHLHNFTEHLRKGEFYDAEVTASKLDRCLGDAFEVRDSPERDLPPHTTVWVVILCLVLFSLPSRSSSLSAPKPGLVSANFWEPSTSHLLHAAATNTPPRRFSKRPKELRSAGELKPTLAPQVRVWGLEQATQLREWRTLMGMVADPNNTWRISRWEIVGMARMCMLYIDHYVPLPDALLIELHRAVDEVGVHCQHAQAQSITQWQPFTFQLPPFDMTWKPTALGPVRRSPGPLGPQTRYAFPVNPAATVAFRDVKARELRWVDPPTPPPSTTPATGTRWISVSEMGMHSDVLKDFWFAHELGDGEYEVYDLADVLGRPRQLSDVETRAYMLVNLEYNAFGKKVKAASDLESILPKHKPLGRLMQFRRYEDVLERDGRLHADHWILLGKYVFDISANLLTPNEIVQLNSLARSTVNHRPDMTRVIRDKLQGRRCGFVNETTTDWVGDRIFTIQELGRFRFRETGSYCAVDDKVYDLGALWELHPGGYKTLKPNQRQFNSADVGWLAFHPPAMMSAFDNFIVGRLVPTKPTSSPVGANEIIMSGIVYAPDAATCSPDLMSRLAPFLGTNNPSTMPKELYDELVRRRDLIVAKVATPTDRRFTRDELATKTQLPSVSEKSGAHGSAFWLDLFLVEGVDEHGPLATGAYSAFVALDNVVYDLTPFVLFSPVPEHATVTGIRTWSGRILTRADDPGLYNTIARECADFVIGFVP